MMLDWNDKYKNSDFHKNLVNNQNIYTSPYDVYESMMHIALGNATYSNLNENNKNIEQSRGKTHVKM